MISKMDAGHTKAVRANVSINDSANDSISAFTIFELLLVIVGISMLAVISIMSSAGRLTGAGGTGSVKALVSAIDFARNYSTLHSTDTYVVFTDGDLSDAELDYRQYAVFADDDDSTTTSLKETKQVMPWKSLPPEFRFAKQSDSDSEGAGSALQDSLTTLLDAEFDSERKFSYKKSSGNLINYSFPYLEFNKYGKVVTPSSSNNLHIRLLQPEQKNTTDSETMNEKRLPLIKIYQLNGRVELLNI